MPACSSTSQSSACTLASWPFQKEQKGSSLGSPGSAGLCPASANWGGSCTRSTSQSEQRVKPGRYSALHCGQNMSFRSLQQKGPGKPESLQCVKDSLRQYLGVTPRFQNRNE